MSDGRRLVSVIVPVYNNATSLPYVVEALAAVAAARPQLRFEFVFVDDGSRDSSYAVLAAAHDRDSRVRVVRFARNFGSTAGLLAGVDAARGEAVVSYAADMQEPPELVGQMIDAWLGGERLVVAARETRDESRVGLLFSRVFYSLFRRFAIATMPEGGYDMFLVDAAVREHIVGSGEINVYLPGLLLWYGFEPHVIRYHRRRRQDGHGRSGWTNAKRLKYMIDAFVAFTYLPLRAASVLGVLLALLGFLYAVIVVAARLVTQRPTEGWAALMVALLVISGAQLVIVGTLGEYLWRVLDQVRGRPRYVIDVELGAIASPAQRASGR